MRCCFHKISKHLKPRCDYETGASTVKWAMHFYRVFYRIWSHRDYKRWNNSFVLTSCWVSCSASCLSPKGFTQAAKQPDPAPPVALTCLPVFLLFITPTCDESVWQFSRLIGNNNRNCKLRILPDCHIGIWNIIYTVWECVISFCFSDMSLYSVFNINWPFWSCTFLFLSSWASCFHGSKTQWTGYRFWAGILTLTLKL